MKQVAILPILCFSHEIQLTFVCRRKSDDGGFRLRFLIGGLVVSSVALTRRTSDSLCDYLSYFSSPQFGNNILVPGLVGYLLLFVHGASF
jgi:hypothetical protein